MKVISLNFFFQLIEDCYLFGKNLKIFEFLLVFESLRLTVWEYANSKY